MQKKRPAGPGHRRVLIMALLAVLLTVGFPSTASATTTVLKSSFTGMNVEASFQHRTPDGCEYSDAHVFADNGTNKNTVTGKTGSSVLTVYLDYNDYCPNSYNFSGLGQVDLSKGQLSVDKQLGTATLQAIVPVFNGYTSSTVDVSVALTWTATGGPATSKVSSKVTSEDGTKIFSESSGTSRQASASGAVRAEAINFTPFPSDSAFIRSTKSGSLQLSKS